MLNFCERVLFWSTMSVCEFEASKKCNSLMYQQAPPPPPFHHKKQNTLKQKQNKTNKNMHSFTSKGFWKLLSHHLQYILLQGIKGILYK